MRNSVTLSMASRYDNSPSGYKSGEIIAQDVEYPTASSTAFISPGNAPLTLFTATQPANLLTTSITNLEPGKSYLIVITNEITGTDTLDKISVIESNLTDADVIFTQPAIFTQIYNSVSGLQYINIGVNDIQSGRIFYNDWIAVVLDENVQSIIINGITFPFIPDKTARGLLIAAGAGGVSNLYNVSRASMGSSNRSYRRRFVNATTEVNKVNFRIETESTDNFADIGKASEPLEVFREGKISINAINADNGQQFFRVTGIDQLLGKNYSLILSGNSGHGFTIYPLQEY
jgi:hypothetical protein